MKPSVDILDHIHRNKDIISICDGVPIYQVGRYLYYGQDRVTSEFISFIKIPFSYVSHIRFNPKRYLNSNSRRLRSAFVNLLLKEINAYIIGSYPKIISGKRTIRCILKTEYGSIDDQAHVHILWLIDERVRDLVSEAVFEFFSNHMDKTSGPIQSIVTQPIQNVGEQISYFCKVQGTRDPDYQYFNGFKRILKKYQTSAAVSLSDHLEYQNQCHSLPAFLQRTVLLPGITSGFSKPKTSHSWDFSFQSPVLRMFMRPSIPLWDTTLTASRNQLTE